MIIIPRYMLTRFAERIHELQDRFEIARNVLIVS